MKKRDRKILAIGAAFAMAAAGTYFFVRQNRRYHAARPPKKAPQIPIENPGDQSEFTTSFSPSELG